jgi:hypothetical protein
MVSEIYFMAILDKPLEAFSYFSWWMCISILLNIIFPVSRTENSINGKQITFFVAPSLFNNAHEYKASISLNTFRFLLLKPMTRNRTLTQGDNLVLLHLKLYYGVGLFFMKSELKISHKTRITHCKVE